MPPSISPSRADDAGEEPEGGELEEVAELGTSGESVEGGGGSAALETRLLSSARLTPLSV